MPAVLSLGKNTSTHLVGGWVDLRSILHILEKRKVSCRLKNKNIWDISGQEAFLLAPAMF
jgi:hypothetical protein